MSRDALTLKGEFEDELGAANTPAELELLRVKYLGRKSALSGMLRALGEKKLTPGERREAGARLNELKTFIEEKLLSKTEEVRSAGLRARLASEKIDVTLPGSVTAPGSIHPLTRVLEQIAGIFVSMGFLVEEGPEVELDYYNFEALNIPREHPARDMQDTFYVSTDVVLRTHTSPVQVRVMQKKRPPFRVIAPGKVYRCDADVSHTPMFHQIEGLLVGQDVSFAHLKAVLEEFIHKVFSPGVPVRFRPSYFPFTEPSAEVDIGCMFCRGSGCKLCKGAGWIEILGAGMVNPRVFEMAGYEPGRYTGFAFGMGIERIAMLKYSIDDIRLFFENDIRFLRQF